MALPTRQKRSPGATTLVVLGGTLVAAYVPSWSHLKRVPLPGYSAEYAMTRSLFAPLRERCAAKPGTVLAEHNDGHYVRFHTECSVISNNLILSPQSIQKLSETERLFRSSAGGLLRDADWIDYAIVRRADNVLDRTQTLADVVGRNAGLRYELLLSAKASPPGFELLAEVSLRQRGRDGEPAPIPIARVYALHRER